MKKKKSGQSGQSCGRGLGEKIVSRQTDAKNPIRKVVWSRLVAGAGKNRPAAEKVGQDCNANRKATEEIGAGGYPTEKDDKRGDMH